MGRCPSERTGSSCSKDPSSPRLSGEGFKDSVRKKVMGFMITSRTVLWLIGNWVVSLQAALSIFRFQLVWGLSAGGQHTVNFFHQQGVSVSAKPLHGYCSGYYF